MPITYNLETLQRVQARMKRCPKKQPKTQYSVRETVVFLLQDVREMLGKGYSKGEIAEVFAAEGCEISRHFWRIYRSMESTQHDETTAQTKGTAMAHENDETGDKIGPDDAEIRGQNCTESTSEADPDVAYNLQESGTSLAQEVDINANSIGTDTGHDSVLEAGQKNPFIKILKGRFEIKPDTEDL